METTTNDRWLAHTTEAWKLYPASAGFSQKAREEHLDMRLAEDADRAAKALAVKAAGQRSRTIR